MNGELSRAARAFAWLIPAGDRESIIGDLVEDAGFRGLSGTRRDMWVAAECGAIGAGLAVTRARGWLVLPPVRELAAGFAVDGTHALRSARPVGAVLRAILFCGSVATLALGVEVLVGSLLSASGF